MYKAGESIKASDEQLIALQKSGVEVADQSTYNNHQKLLTAVAGKKVDNNGIEVTNKQFATDSFYIASSQEALKNNALSVASLDKNILNLAKDGQTIVGGRALIQKIQNSFKAAGDIDILDNADLNQETFDTEVDSALIKYAVALLGEGGKTISDKERAMLYQTLKATQNIIKTEPVIIKKEPVEEVDIGKYD